ncbi:ISNCY family transposase, partial [Vibrio parahaemolyticus]
FQDRLVPELRLHHITDIQSANEYLQNQFIPLYWQQKIAVQAKNPRSAFKVVPEHINLDTVCVHKEYRKVRRDHTFSYNNKMYLIDSPIRHSIVNQKLEIRCQFDGAFSAYFGHRKLHITELEEPPRACEYGMEVQRKLDVIELADRLGNATEAARLTGCSRRSI